MLRRIFLLRLLFGGKGCFLGGLLLLAGRNLAVGDGGGALQGADRACGNTNTLATDANRLQVHVLFTLGSDIGVAARIGRVSALASQLVDAGHRNGGILAETRPFVNGRGYERMPS